MCVCASKINSITPRYVNKMQIKCYNIYNTTRKQNTLQNVYEMKEENIAYLQM